MTDREAWRAAIHGVAKSRTRLSMLGSMVSGLPDGNLLITNTPQKDPLIPEGA